MGWIVIMTALIACSIQFNLLQLFHKDLIFGCKSKKKAVLSAARTVKNSNSPGLIWFLDIYKPEQFSFLLADWRLGIIDPSKELAIIFITSFFQKLIWERIQLGFSLGSCHPAEKLPKSKIVTFWWFPFPAQRSSSWDPCWRWSFEDWMSWSSEQPDCFVE